MLIYNTPFMLIIVGLLTIFTLYVNELYESNELNFNKTKIKKIINITVKTNLIIGFLSILIISFYLF